MVTLREVAVIALLAGALFFGLVAAIGLVRLPDLYTRAHSASKSDTLGAVLAFAAAAVALGVDADTLKLGLLILFMFITNPTAAHAIVRAAAEQGIEPWTVGDADDAEPEAGGTPDDAGAAGDDRGGEPAADGGERR